MSTSHATVIRHEAPTTRCMSTSRALGDEVALDWLVLESSVAHRGAYWNSGGFDAGVRCIVMPYSCSLY